MQKKYLYITLSVIIIVLAAILIGWATFISRKQYNLTTGTANKSIYINTPGSSTYNKSPFGTISNVPATTAVGTFTGGTTIVNDTFTPIIHQIYSLPVSGFTTNASSTVFFVDRSTGHIFENKDTASSTARINKTTMSNIYKALFLNSGEYLLRRSIDSYDTIITSYSSTKKDTSINTNFSINILTIVSSPDTTRIAYLEKTKGGSQVVIANSDGTGKKVIFHSRLRGWLLQWQRNTILLTQKASGTVPGSAFLLTLPKVTIKVALVQKLGLQTNLSPNGKRILYDSISKEGTPLLFVKDIATNTIIPLELGGFASKCVWKNDNNTLYCGLSTIPKKGIYPDKWMQGVIHFSDSLWKIDIQSLLFTKIVDIPKVGNVSIDMIVPTLTKKEDILLFINNIDQTLWSITLQKTPITKTP